MRTFITLLALSSLTLIGCGAPPKVIEIKTVTPAPVKKEVERGPPPVSPQELSGEVPPLRPLRTTIPLVPSPAAKP